MDNSILGIIDDQGRLNKKNKPSDIAPTLRAESHGNIPKIVIPVLTPDRVKKRQNGRRFKEDGEPAFTLTAQDRHGVAIGFTCDVLKDLQRDNIFPIGIDDTYGYDGVRIYDDGYMPTLRSSRFGLKVGIQVDIDGKEEKDNLENKEHPGIYVQLSNDCTVYAVWYEKYECYIAIRKLTPKECFRLQGWEDEYYERAEFVNSDSQLYKQAGNGVTVPVIYEIAKKLYKSK